MLFSKSSHRVTCELIFPVYGLASKSLQPQERAGYTFTTVSLCGITEVDEQHPVKRPGYYVTSKKLCGMTRGDSLVMSGQDQFMMGEARGTFKKHSRAVGSAAGAGAPRRRMRLPHAVSVLSSHADAEPPVLMQRLSNPRLRLLRAGRPSALITHTQATSFLSLPRPRSFSDSGWRQVTGFYAVMPCVVHLSLSVLPRLTVPDRRSFYNHGNC